MKPQLKYTLALMAFMLAAGPLWAAGTAGCPAASRYVMPEGVETGAESAGAAPADLPGSRSGYKVPPKLGFDLGINPAGSKFDESRLPLGHVEIDRKTGQSTIDGALLGGPSEPEAECGEAEGSEAR